MSFAKVKKELVQLDKEQLIELFGAVYKFKRPAKIYLEFFADPNLKKLLDESKAVITAAWTTHNHYQRPRIAEAKRTVREFRQLEVGSEWEADVMLYYVEAGMNHVDERPQEDFEPMLRGLVNAYVQALTFMKKEGLLDKFADRNRQLWQPTGKRYEKFCFYFMKEYELFYP